MNMHGCVFGFGYFGRDSLSNSCHKHGPHHNRSHGGHHRHHGYHGPHRHIFGPQFGHPPLHRGPNSFGFHCKPKHARLPEGFGEFSSFGPGMYDTFIDNNGFEWRLHLPHTEDGNGNQVGEEKSANRDRPQRWSKHGKRMFHRGGHMHRGFIGQGHNMKGRKCENNRMAPNVVEEYVTPAPEETPHNTGAVIQELPSEKSATA